MATGCIQGFGSAFWDNTGPDQERSELLREIWRAGKGSQRSPAAWRTGPDAGSRSARTLAVVDYRGFISGVSKMFATFDEDRSTVGKKLSGVVIQDMGGIGKIQI